MQKRIYLDNNATTSVDAQVREIYLEAEIEAWANPSSMHTWGQKSRSFLTEARQVVADYFLCKSQEIIYTSSGTEALNLVIRGLFGLNPKGHIITSDVEHPAVYNTIKALEVAGVKVTWLKTGQWGAASASQVEDAITQETKAIVLMAVNNETGVMTDIETIAALAHKHNVPFIVDGVAMLGKHAIQLHEGISAMCFSGHKIHAPKGVGLAILRRGIKLEPYLTGGGQEAGRRSGTENVASIVALSKALSLVKEANEVAFSTMKDLRDLFERELISNLPDIDINGAGPRICNTSNISFAGVDGETLLMYLDVHKVAASHGSACSSGARELSRVLLNMGYSPKRVGSSLRFSLSRKTTPEEIYEAVDILCQGVKKLRGM